MDELVESEELKVKRIHFFNPLTILFMMIGISIMLIFANQVQYYMFLIIGFVTYIITTKEKIIKPLSLIIVMNCLLYPLRALAPKSIWAGSIFSMFLIFVKLIPVFLLVKALMDYSPSELTSSFRRIGIHENISIAVTIFFRYLPEFKNQIQEVKQGAKIRGLSMSPFHPKKSFEQLVVPLIYKGLQISDTVTCSIITKGVEYPTKKTNYRDICFLAQDYICICIMLIIMGGVVWTKIL